MWWFPCSYLDQGSKGGHSWGKGWWSSARALLVWGLRKWDINGWDWAHESIKFLDHVITRWVIYQPYNILLMEETLWVTRVLEHSYSKAFRGGRCIRHLRSLEVVATFTNAVLWAGTHNPQMTNFSRPCLISTCTQTTGRRLNSSIGAMFLDSMIAVGIICMYCLEVADHWLSDASCRATWA